MVIPFLFSTVFTWLLIVQGLKKKLCSISFSSELPLNLDTKLVNWERKYGEQYDFPQTLSGLKNNYRYNFQGLIFYLEFQRLSSQLVTRPIFKEKHSFRRYSCAFYMTAFFK